MPDFNTTGPNKKITDPQGLGANANFPRHVHKFKAQPKDEKGAPLDHYTSGEYLVVHNDDELEAALKEGWSLDPVLTDPDAPKPEKPKPEKPKK